MIKFQCGVNCGCSDTECTGNRDPKLVKEFDRAKLLDLNFLEECAISFRKIDAWTKDSIAEVVGKLDNRKGVSLNIALTGKPSNQVPLFDCLEILGKEEVLSRLTKPMQRLFND